MKTIFFQLLLAFYRKRLFLYMYFAQSSFLQFWKRILSIPLRLYTY